MMSTRTKRVLSVLSAGALIASMSAIPVFAAAGTLTTANKDKVTWKVTGASEAALSGSVAADGKGEIELYAQTSDFDGDNGVNAIANTLVYTATPSAGSATTLKAETVSFSAKDTYAKAASFTVPKNTTLNTITWKITSDVTEADLLGTFTQAAAKDISASQSYTYNKAADSITDIDSVLTKAKAEGDNAQAETWTLVPASIKINGSAVSGATGATKLTASDKSLEFDATATPKDGYLIGGKTGSQTVHFSITIAGDTAVDESARSLSPYMAAGTDAVSDIKTLVTTDAETIPGVDVGASVVKMEKYDPTKKVWEILSADSGKVADKEQYRFTVSYDAKDGFSSSTGEIIYTVTVKAKTADLPASFENGAVTVTVAGQPITVVKSAITNADAKNVSLPTGVEFKAGQGPANLFAAPKLYKSLDDAKNDKNEVPATDADSKPTVISAGTYYTVYTTDGTPANEGVVQPASSYVATEFAASTKMYFKVSVTTASSNNNSDDEDTGNSSDTAPDFTEKEMVTSSDGGNKFNHPDEKVLQDKLNNNKGTTISIGEVKNGTASVATFAVTLPAKSSNVSQNTVNKVLNVLTTINTKSASSNAQSAVNELLKSVDDKNTASMPISFSKSMSDFGMTVSVTVPVTSKFTNGGTNLFYYNPTTKKLEAQKSTVTIRGGKATFDLTHASEYFLIQGVKDLSAGEGVNDSEDTLSSSDTATTTAASSEAPVVTAPEVTQAPEATTAPVVATNPGTGNAPIALAVIPVAVAAAAIIAKKAK